MYSLYDNEANFARREGSRDKKKRRRSIGFYAGAGAGLAALGGAGYRYGGAELAGRSTKGSGTLSESKYTSLKASRPGGAKRQLDSDYAALKDMGSKMKAGAGRAKDYVATNYNNPGQVWSDVSGAAKSGYNRASSAAKRAYDNIPGGRGGKIAAAGLAAAGIAGAGYAGYRATKRKKKSTLDRLLGR